MISIFHGRDKESHQNFQTWRKLNADGFHMTEGGGGFFTVHYTQDRRENPSGRGCMHQGRSNNKYLDDKDGCYTTARKVCSNSLAELLAWAKENGFIAKNCKHCDTVKFPFPSAPTQSGPLHNSGTKAQQQETTLDGTQHFIAYHSVPKMGEKFKSRDKLRFFSRKLALLKKAVGNIVWVIQGEPSSHKMSYTLCGAYVPDQVEIEDEFDGLYIISGRRVREFAPQARLNDFDWFAALFESQRNFSLGFNRIGDEDVIQGLISIPPKNHHLFIPSELPPDIDLTLTGSEGGARLVSHLRRERNRAIIEAKKAATLKAKGHLCCEACGFDFRASYGALGDGFCEVHHLVPLSALHAHRDTKLNDLAVLCSNCHRIIHRASPMLSVEDLSKVVTPTCLDSRRRTASKGL